MNKNSKLKVIFLHEISFLRLRLYKFWRTHFLTIFSENIDDILSYFWITVGADHFGQVTFRRDVLGVVIQVQNKKTMEMFIYPIGFIEPNSHTDVETTNLLVNILKVPYLQKNGFNRFSSFLTVRDSDNLSFRSFVTSTIGRVSFL